MPEGRVTYAERDGWHVLRYFGRVDFSMAPAIDHFVEGLMQGEAEQHPFLFDLSEARLVDSTNLGLMARLADRVHPASGCRSAIVSTRADIDDVLGSMGFRDIFDIVTDHGACSHNGSTCEATVTGEASSQGELLRTMLEAHRTLVSLNDKDRDEFKEVVRMLEAETMRSR